MQAVLTADIVNSTQLTNERFHALEEDIRYLYEGPFKLLFYRGDSYQVLAFDAMAAYKRMLLSRLKAISYSEKPKVDVRYSIQIGNVDSEVNDIGSHVDPVFVNSGRNFDKFSGEESDRLLLISCEKAGYDLSYELLARYTDTLLSRITSKQAIIAYHLLSGKTQKDTAALMGVSGPTVSQQAKAGYVPEFEILTEKYKELTQMVTDYGS